MIWFDKRNADEKRELLICIDNGRNTSCTDF